MTKTDTQRATPVRTWDGKVRPQNNIADSETCYEVFQKDAFLYERSRKGWRFCAKKRLYAMRLINRARQAAHKMFENEPEKFARLLSGEITGVPVEANNYSDAVVVDIPREFRGTQIAKTARETARRNFIRFRQQMSGSLKKVAENSDPAGFPFILGIKHHSRKRSDGKLVEMENGHGALILEINPRYVFGEQWSPKQPHAAPDPQILPGSAADFFPSMVTNCQQLYDQKNEKKEEAENGIPAEAVKVSASGSVTKKNERTRPKQATPATSNHQKNEKKFPAGAAQTDAAGAGGDRAAARQCLEMLENRLIRPFLSQIRNSDGSNWADGKRKSLSNFEANCILQNFEVLLKKYAIEQVETAVEREASRLRNNETAFLFHPVRWTNPTKSTASIRFVLEKWVIPSEKRAAAAPQPAEIAQKSTATETVQWALTRLKTSGIDPKGKIAPETLAMWVRKKGAEAVRLLIEGTITLKNRKKTPVKCWATYLCALYNRGADFQDLLREKVVENRRKLRADLADQALRIDSAWTFSQRFPAEKQDEILRSRLENADYQQLMHMINVAKICDSNENWRLQTLRHVNQYFGTTLPENINMNVQNLALFVWVVKNQAA